MLTTTFPALEATSIEAINTLAKWLACNDFSSTPSKDDTDFIVLAGNAVIPTLDAACQLSATTHAPLLITGGIGHSTTFLYAAIAEHPRYNKIPTTGRTEAAIIKDIAIQFWNIHGDNVFTEEKSTNCGENARFTQRYMRAQGLAPERVILIQDPTMQRRTVATFERAWQGETYKPQWYSWPGIIPIVGSDERTTKFIPDEKGLWPIERFISLILGEIPRLNDDAQGYGPNGRDFITHVEIPAQVMDAWHLLQSNVALKQLMTERGL